MILKATVLVALTQLAEGQERDYSSPSQSIYSLFSFPKWVSVGVCGCVCVHARVHSCVLLETVNPGPYTC